MPAVAAEMHDKNLPVAISKLKDYIRSDRIELDGVAYTAGPGLAMSLRRGYQAAHRLASELDCPLLPVHHLEGHVLSCALAAEQGDAEAVELPLACLVASGGHTSLVLASGPGQFKVLGETLDDALGEAWDKAARMCYAHEHAERLWEGRDMDRDMDMGTAEASNASASSSTRPVHYGACLEWLAEELQGDPDAVPLPLPMRSPRVLQRQASTGRWDFSFAGLKTAFERAVLGRGGAEAARSDVRLAADLAASFQAAAVRHVVTQLEGAFGSIVASSERWGRLQAAAAGGRMESPSQSKAGHSNDLAVKAGPVQLPGLLVCGGGAAANMALRAGLEQVATKFGMRVLYPPLQLCTDNAEMIGAAAIARLVDGVARSGNGRSIERVPIEHMGERLDPA